MTTIRLLGAGLLLALLGGAADAQVRENLGPANPHGRMPPRVAPSGPSQPTIPRGSHQPPGPGPGGQTGGRNGGMNGGQAQPQVQALFARLGLTFGKRVATGRVFNLHPDGRVASQMGTYQVTSDERFMIFPGVVNTRLDLSFAVFNPATNVIGCKFNGIDLRTATNTGGGGINLSLAGTGPVRAEIQTWFDVVGGRARDNPSPRQLILFVPD